jgi:hypothetical protein
MNLKVAINAGPVGVLNRTVFVLDMTAYARYRRTSYEELIAYRAVRSMTNATAFPHRFMLEDERASLLFVTLEAFLSLAQQTGA